MRREGVLERSWEQGWHPGWASWERSELSGMLAVTENPSNKTLCTSLRHCLVCAQLLLRSHTAVQEPTWRRGCSHGLSWVCLPAGSYSAPSLPSRRHVRAPSLMVHDWERRNAGKTIPHLLTKGVRRQLDPAAPDAVFPSPAIPWGAGPVCARSVGLSLLADISPFLSLNPRDVPFRQRSLLGEQGTPLTQAPLGSWSFN